MSANTKMKGKTTTMSQRDANIQQDPARGKREARQDPTAQQKPKPTSWLKAYLQVCGERRIEPYYGFLSAPRVTRQNIIDVDTDFCTPETWRLFTHAMKCDNAGGVVKMSFRRDVNRGLVHPPHHSSRVMPVMDARKQYGCQPVDEATVLKLVRGVESIVKHSYTSLRSLAIVNHPMKKPVVQVLVGVLPTCERLQSVSFDGCGIGDESLRELSQWARAAKNLESLSLAACGLTDAGLKYVASIINGQSSARNELVWADSLRKDTLYSTASKQQRADDIPTKGLLCSLDLSRNHIGLDPEGISMLCKVLHDNVCISWLSLAGNCLDAAGMGLLCRMLSYNVVLAVCDMSNNPGVTVVDHDPNLKEEVNAIEEHLLVNQCNTWASCGDAALPFLFVRNVARKTAAQRGSSMKTAAVAGAGSGRGAQVGGGVDRSPARGGVDREERRLAGGRDLGHGEDDQQEEEEEEYVKWRQAALGRQYEGLEMTGEQPNDRELEGRSSAYAPAAAAIHAVPEVRKSTFGAAAASNSVQQRQHQGQPLSVHRSQQHPIPTAAVLTQAVDGQHPMHQTAPNLPTSPTLYPGYPAPATLMTMPHHLHHHHHHHQSFYQNAPVPAGWPYPLVGYPPGPQGMPHHAPPYYVHQHQHQHGYHQAQHQQQQERPAACPAQRPKKMRKKRSDVTAANNTGGDGGQQESPVEVAELVAEEQPPAVDSVNSSTLGSLPAATNINADASYQDVEDAGTMTVERPPHHTVTQPLEPVLGSEKDIRSELRLEFEQRLTSIEHLRAADKEFMRAYMETVTDAVDYQARVVQESITPHMDKHHATVEHLVQRLKQMEETIAERDEALRKELAAAADRDRKLLASGAAKQRGGKTNVFIVKPAENQGNNQVEKGSGGKDNRTKDPPTPTHVRVLEELIDEQLRTMKSNLPETSRRVVDDHLKRRETARLAREVERLEARPKTANAGLNTSPSGKSRTREQQPAKDVDADDTAVGVGQYLAGIDW